MGQKIFLITSIIFALLCEYPVLGQEKKKVRLSVGYNFYTMEDFNAKLSQEGNRTIDEGVNVTVEFSPASLLLWNQIRLAPMLGFEYLVASSKTLHTEVGGSATVNWDLPVSGVYIAPDILFKKLYFRPIGIGYYVLIDANLTVTDRPGNLKISDQAVGISSQAGFTLYSGDLTELFIEAGYRKLKFTDVSQEPQNGFTVFPGGPLIQPGNLPETLDYSGLVFKVGMSVKF